MQEEPEEPSNENRELEPDEERYFVHALVVRGNYQAFDDLVRELDKHRLHVVYRKSSPFKLVVKEVAQPPAIEDRGE